jgi:AraC-like DNA-binding protein
LAAQPTGTLNVSPHVEEYDAVGAWAWSLALTDAEAFAPPPDTAFGPLPLGNFLRAGYRERRAWLRLRLHNPDTLAREVILLTQNPNLSQVQLGFRAAGDTVAHLLYSLSYRTPQHARPLPHLYFALPLNLAPGQTTVCYLQLGVEVGSLHTPLQVFSPTGFQAWSWRLNIWNALFYALMFGAGITALLLMIVTGRLTYLVYSTFLVCTVTWLSFSDGYFYEIINGIDRYDVHFLRGVFQQLMLGLLAVFVIGILQSFGLRRTWSWRLRWALGGCYGLVFGMGLLGYNNDTLMRWALAFHIVLLVVLNLILIRDSVWAVICGYRPARFLLLSYVPVVFAGFAYLMRNMGLLPHAGLFQYLYNLVYLFQAALLLGAAVWQLRVERQQYRFEALKRLTAEHLVSVAAQAQTPKASDETSDAAAETAQPVGHQNLETLPIPGLPNSQSQLVPELDERDFVKLLQVMQSEKPFLNPKLTLKQLSNAADLPINTTSQLINLFAGKNFNEFVNQYRVEEAKRLLIDENKSRYSLEGLGEMAGFGSRSTFFSIFRRETGLTPAAWKQQPQRAA